VDKAIERQPVFYPGKDEAYRDVDGDKPKLGPHASDKRRGEVLHPAEALIQPSESQSGRPDGCAKQRGPKKEVSAESLIGQRVARLERLFVLAGQGLKTHGVVAEHLALLGEIGLSVDAIRQGHGHVAHDHGRQGHIDASQKKSQLRVCDQTKRPDQGRVQKSV